MKMTVIREETGPISSERTLQITLSDDEINAAYALMPSARRTIIMDNLASADLKDQHKGLIRVLFFIIENEHAIKLHLATLKRKLQQQLLKKKAGKFHDIANS